MAHRYSSEFNRLHRNGENGAAILEFAMGSMMFFFVLLGGIDLVRLAYTSICLEHALQFSHREASMAPSSSSPLQIQQNVESAINKFGISPDEVTVCKSGVPCSAQTPDTGEANEFITISASVPLRIFLGTMTVRLTEKTVMMNEPMA